MKVEIEENIVFFEGQQGMTIEEFAKSRRISRSCVYTALKNGTFNVPFERVGGKVRIFPDRAVRYDLGPEQLRLLSLQLAVEINRINHTQIYDGNKYSRVK